MGAGPRDRAGSPPASCASPNARRTAVRRSTRRWRVIARAIRSRWPSCRAAGRQAAARTCCLRRSAASAARRATGHSHALELQAEPIRAVMLGRRRPDQRAGAMRRAAAGSCPSQAAPGATRGRRLRRPVPAAGPLRLPIRRPQRISPPSPGAPVFATRASAATPLPGALPRVTWRAGLDLAPVDLHDPAQCAWLGTLVWPEHTERLQRLRAAIGIARPIPIRIPWRPADRPGNARAAGARRCDAGGVPYRGARLCCRSRRPRALCPVGSCARCGVDQQQVARRVPPSPRACAPRTARCVSAIG